MPVRPDGYIAWAGVDQLDVATKAAAAVAAWCDAGRSYSALGELRPRLDRGELLGRR